MRGADRGKPLSYAEYLAAPEDRYAALLGGRCFREPPPAANHQLVAGRVFALLDGHVRGRGIGVAAEGLGAYLDERHVLIPDICFVSTPRLDRLTRRGLEGIAPDLCVEVLSPSTARRDRTDKARVYLAFGCREYWLVDVEATSVEVRRPQAGSAVMSATHRAPDTLPSAAVPGLRLALADAFSACRP